MGVLIRSKAKAVPPKGAQWNTLPTAEGGLEPSNIQAIGRENTSYSLEQKVSYR